MAGPVLFRPGNITSGLVGYWKLDEASGSRADSSGNGNTLTDNNTVTSVAQDYWKTGENSADFESGNSEYLSITDASQTGLDLTGSYSIGFWMKAETVTGAPISKWTPSNGYNIQVSVSDGGTVQVNHDGSSYNTIVGLSVGKWTHIFVVYDTTANTLSVYKDGNLAGVQSATTDPSNNATALNIGRRPDGGDYFDGLLKDVAIWNVALTPIQIKSLALGVDLANFAYRPNNVSTQPTAWWKLNELSGNRSDSIGALTLTDNNTVTALGGYIEGVGADFEAGNSEYLSSADNTAFDFSGGIFSVSAWIKPESLAADVPFYCNLTDASNFLRIGTLATGALECVVFSGGGAVVNVTTATGIVKTGTWHHVVVTESGDTWKIYLDGVDVTSGGGTDTSRAANYTGQLEICRRADAGAFWDGVISDLAIWKGYALTDAEIKSLACGIPLQQTGIVSYWKLDETSGSRADSIGANTLTDNNTVLSGAGKVSNAADFELDDSDYLSVVNNDSIDITSDFFLACWFKPESTGVTSINIQKDKSGDGYSLFVDTSNKVTYTINNTGTAGATSVVAGTWYHICGNYTGATKDVYMNSFIDGTAAYTTNPADLTQSLFLGTADGLQDESILAKRWFRDEEIKTIYCKGLAGKELTSSERSLGSGAFFLVF
jgi:hypothetical protein